jgi:flagellar protein FlaG
MRIEPSPQGRESGAEAAAALSAGGARLPQGGKPLPQDPPVRVETARRAAEQIARFLRESGHELSFSVDGSTGRTIVSVRDPATGELIRQMPSEEALRIARNLDQALPALIETEA